MFFAYILKDPRTNKPFYVGKGKGNRPQHHIKEAKKDGYIKFANKHKVNTIRQILDDGFEVIVQKIDADSENDAFEMEELLIAMIGRRDIGTGILTNLTDGGEGTVNSSVDYSGNKNPNYGKTGELSAWFGKKHTEETKAKISLGNKNKIVSEETKLKMRKPKSEAGRQAIALARKTSNYKPSEETKRKQSAALKGRKFIDETKQKMSEASKGVPKKEYVCPHCNKVGRSGMMYRWHFDNCRTKGNI